VDRFRLASNFAPAGDQPQAIRQLVEGVLAGDREQVLLGVTGSGKTFSIAKLIEEVNRPTLVLSHNKTLAAQLFQEFRSFFPDNAVEYFVSYYDYYQPEAYVPQTDTYIEKETSINEEIERLRLSATKSLFERRDVVIVASVSCIYGLGSPEAFFGMLQFFELGHAEGGMDAAMRKMIEMQYERTQYDLFHGSFRARGDVLEILPAYEDRGIRVEYFGDDIERITRFDPLRGEALETVEKIALYPKTHYVTPKDRLTRAIQTIGEELKERLPVLEAEGKLLERQRLEQRTRFDLEMLKELGSCQGSRTTRAISPDGRPASRRRPCSNTFLRTSCWSWTRAIRRFRRCAGCSTATARASRRWSTSASGCRARSTTGRCVSRSSRSASGSASTSRRRPPTGSCSAWAACSPSRSSGRPGWSTRRSSCVPPQGQVDDLVAEIRETVDRKERVLVTTLTKRMAEELTQYFTELGMRVRYLHSDIQTLERVEILTSLRRGEFDVLVGINLLREGLDLPEVSLVAILDADKEGFLRSKTSLIQTIGRAARNVNGRAILYADRRTDSLEAALDETRRRREKQVAYNLENGIEPQTILKDIHNPLVRMSELDYRMAGAPSRLLEVAEGDARPLTERISELEKEMRAAAKRLEFEEAAALRDRLKELRELQIYSG
jgi:excinuclease ABC subunit B